MPITEQQRDFADKLLRDSLAALRSAVETLPPERWQSRQGGWSVLQVVEHCYVVEVGIIRRIPTMPPPSGMRDDRDERIVGWIRDRSTKVEAPPGVVPEGRTANPAELLTKLDRLREKTLGWLHDPAAEHRAHAMEHPFLKLLDGYQWLLMIGAHMERHTAQIREILDAPDAA